MPRPNFINPPDPQGGEAGGGTRLIATAQGFVGGLDTEESSRHINPDSTPDMANFRFQGTEVQKSYGWTKFGMATGSISLNPLRIISFKDGTGTEHLIYLNNDAVYRYTAASDTWTSLGTGLFSMDDGDRFDWTLLASDNAPGSLDATRNLIAVSNGVDRVHFWDGDSGTTLFTASTVAPICKYVEAFGNRLVCGYIIDPVTGQNYSQRIQWSVNGDIEGSASDAWTDIGSGTVDLTTSSGAITQIKALRGNLAVYKEDGIESAFITGQAVAPFAFLPAPGPGIGLQASGTLTQLPFGAGAHIFLGTDYNVYTFDGNQLQPIGAAIRREIERTINRNALYAAFGLVHERNTEYWLHIPVGASLVPTVAYVYNWTYQTWSRRDFKSFEIYCGSNTTFSQSFTFNDLSTAVDSATTFDDLSQLGTFDDLSGGLTREQIIYGLNEPNAFPTNNTKATVRASENLRDQARAVSVSNATTLRNTTSLIVGDQGTAWSNNDAIKELGGGLASSATGATTTGPLDNCILPAFEISSSDVPSDAVITGVEVQVRGYGNGAAGANRQFYVELYESINTRTQYTGTGTKTGEFDGPLVGNISTITFGGPTDLWGAASISINDLFDNLINGVGIAKLNSTGSIFVDYVTYRVWFSSSALSDEVIESYITTRDHDFGLPNRAKTLERVVLRYRDVSTTMTDVEVFSSVDRGQTFSMGSTITTAGNGDGAIREAYSDIFQSGNAHRVKIQHAGRGENLVIVEVELQALLRGRSWGV